MTHVEAVAVDGEEAPTKQSTVRKDELQSTESTPQTSSCRESWEVLGRVTEHTEYTLPSQHPANGNSAKGVYVRVRFPEWGGISINKDPPTPHTTLSVLS